MNRFLFFTLALALSGCGWAPMTVKKPALIVPQGWQMQDTGAGYVAHVPHWWDHFNDPQLSVLINQMLVTNNDLAKAGLQLQQARVAAGLTDTNLSPDATAGAQASNDKKLRGAASSTESYNAAFSLSYELDLWGKLARSREQSAWLVNASEQDKQATALTLIGQTAQFYWQIASLNQQINNQRQSIEIARQTADFVRARFQAGAVGQMDCLQAEQSLIGKENRLKDLREQREETRNALAILFNRPPSWRVAEASELIDVALSVPATLPVDMISARPDVQAAEWRLRAALAGSEVARLSFYPTLSLSAGLSSGSALFSQWFNQPARAVGSAVSLPFIEWNTVRLTIEQSDIAAKQAEVVFRDAVYQALKDVDNAMAQRLNAQSQMTSQVRNLELSQQRLSLSNQQYAAGAVSFQTLLDAQDALLDGQNALLTQRYNYLNATMQLWLALGGETKQSNRESTYGKG